MIHITMYHIICASSLLCALLLLIIYLLKDRTAVHFTQKEVLKMINLAETEIKALEMQMLNNKSYCHNQKSRKYYNQLINLNKIIIAKCNIVIERGGVKSV